MSDPNPFKRQLSDAGNVLGHLGNARDALLDGATQAGKHLNRAKNAFFDPNAMKAAVRNIAGQGKARRRRRR